jgi:hypothetical protein
MLWSSSLRSHSRPRFPNQSSNWCEAKENILMETQIFAYSVMCVCVRVIRVRVSNDCLAILFVCLFVYLFVSCCLHTCSRALLRLSAFLLCVQLCMVCTTQKDGEGGTFGCTLASFGIESVVWYSNGVVLMMRIRSTHQRGAKKWMSHHNPNACCCALLCVVRCSLLAADCFSCCVLCVHHHVCGVVNVLTNYSYSMVWYTVYVSLRKLYLSYHTITNCKYYS